MKVILLYDNTNKMIIHINISKVMSDIDLFKTIKEYLLPGDILLLDGAYACQEELIELHEKNIKFVVHVSKSNTNIINNKKIIHKKKSVDIKCVEYIKNFNIISIIKMINI